MPTDVPPAVHRTFDRLKQQRDDYIELKEIDGRCYVLIASHHGRESSYREER